MHKAAVTDYKIQKYIIYLEFNKFLSLCQARLAGAGICFQFSACSFIHPLLNVNMIFWMITFDARWQDKLPYITQVSDVTIFL